LHLFNRIQEAVMKFFVTGATGTVGRQIVVQLLEAGHSVRALTRNPAKANFPAGVEVITGDLATPQTFASALEGVDGLHLIAFAGDDFAPLQSAPEILALAEKAGVQRVTLLLGGDTQAVEAAIKASRLAWTFLQPVEFMSNMLEWVAPVREEGVIREGFASRRSAIVHEADIAAVAVAALTQEGHGGQTYTITGPESLTPVQMAQMIAAAAGRAIHFEELTPEEARARWQAQGFPDETIEFFFWVYGNTPEIGYTVVPTVEQVTGRPARSVAQWAAEHADAFRA
jgi:uncharacterized protein YbjT (DUF2867 family)